MAAAAFPSLRDNDVEWPNRGEIKFDKIIATYRVDEATQLTMEDIIAKNFADGTVISIVHRYGNILTSDKVVLLECGVLVEFDRPDVLLSRESKFRDLYTTTRIWTRGR
ncbi:hypothetical protein BJX76DRAFT_357015 [Aspergillus varians]